MSASIDNLVISLQFFNDNNGIIDLKKNIWRSYAIYKNKRIISVDYTAPGRFKNTCAYFNGENSRLYVANRTSNKIGREIADNESFFISLWLNSNPEETNLNQYFISTDNTTNANGNLYSFYMVYDEGRETLNFVLNGNKDATCISRDALELYKPDEWNHILMYKSDNKVWFYLNGKMVDENPIEFKSDFKFGDNITVGKGYDVEKEYNSSLKGYLDDLCVYYGDDTSIFKDNTIGNDLIIPTTYMASVIIPEFKELEDSEWIEKEKEFSRYNRIVDTVEDKRFRTHIEYEKIQNGLCPYVINNISVKKIEVDTPEWVRPKCFGYYRKSDKVFIGRIFNNGMDTEKYADIYTSNYDYNTYSPDDKNVPDNKWNFIKRINMKYNELPWQRRRPAYNFLNKVVFHKRIYQSRINFNKKLPAYWVLINSGNSSKGNNKYNTKRWDSLTLYNTNDIVYYENTNGIYQSTTSNNINNIPGDESAWKRVKSNDFKGIKFWMEPNPYMKGDIVIFGDKFFYCNIDNTISQPEKNANHWTEIKEYTPPTYESVYKNGDRVVYKSVFYECINTSDTNPCILAPNEIKDKVYGKFIRDTNPNKEYSEIVKNIEEIPTLLYKDASDIVDISKAKLLDNYKHYKKGDIVYYDKNLPHWKFISDLEVYPKDGMFIVSKTKTAITLRLWNVFDNTRLSNSNNNRYQTLEYINAVNNKMIESYIVLINGVFVPWEYIYVIISDRYSTLIIDNLSPRDSRITNKSIQIIKIPFKVHYSNTGEVVDNGTKLFSFDKNGRPGGNKYVFSTSNPNIRCLYYQLSKNRDYPDGVLRGMTLDVDLTHRITDSNIFLFENNFVRNKGIGVGTGNILDKVYINNSNHVNLYCIWYDTENESEENSAKPTNQEDVRRYLTDRVSDDDDKELLSMAKLNLNKSFAIAHTNKYKYDFDRNVRNSIKTIYDYDKTKFDKVYEEIRPINMKCYSNEFMKSFKRTITMPLNDSNKDVLIPILKKYAYMVDKDNARLFKLNDSNINKYIGTVISFKLPNTISLPSFSRKEYELLGEDILIRELSDSEFDPFYKISESNIGNFLNKPVDIMTKSIFKRYEEEFGIIIMSRDIYNKDDNKNNTYVMVFQNGLLPRWYKNIKYTNDTFYLNNISKPINHKVTITPLDKQNIIVFYKGVKYSGNDVNEFEVEDGDSLNSIQLEVDKGYIPGKLNFKVNTPIYKDITITATSADIKFFNVWIKKSDNQRITSKLVGNKYIELDNIEGLKSSYTDEDVKFRAPYGTHIVSSVEVTKKGYDAGTINNPDFILTKDETIKVSQSTLHKYKVKVINPFPDDQDIIVHYNGKTYINQSFEGYYNTTYTIETRSKKNGYIPGPIIDKGHGIISDDTSISIGAMSKLRFTICIGDSMDHQDYKVEYKGRECNYNDKFIAEYMDEISLTVDTEAGYKFCGLSKDTITSFNTNNSLFYKVNYMNELTNHSEHFKCTFTVNNIVEGDSDNEYVKNPTVKFIGVNNPTIKYFTCYITQPDHEIITVYCNGKEYTSTFKAPYGSKVTAKVTKLDYGYIMSPPVISSPIIHDDITVRAEGSKLLLDSFLVTIKQSPHQTIKVHYKGKTYTSSFYAEYMSNWSAEITDVDFRYDAGKLNKSSGTIDGPITIEATPATLKTFLVTIYQSPHQTIRVYCNGEYHTSSFYATYGDTWTASITDVEKGYDPGSLYASSGTVTGPTTIEATRATLGNTRHVVIDSIDKYNHSGFKNHWCPTIGFSDQFTYDNMEAIHSNKGSWEYPFNEAAARGNGSVPGELGSIDIPYVGADGKEVYVHSMFTVLFLSRIYDSQWWGSGHLEHRYVGEYLVLTDIPGKNDVSDINYVTLEIYDTQYNTLVETIHFDSYYDTHTSGHVPDRYSQIQFKDSNFNGKVFWSYLYVHDYIEKYYTLYKLIGKHHPDFLKGWPEHVPVDVTLKFHFSRDKNG